MHFCCLTALLFFMLSLSGQLFAEDMDDFQLTQSRFHLGEHKPQEKMGEDAWKSVHLPHNWDNSLPDQGGISWYEITSQLDKKPSEPWAVYLPFLNMNAEVYVNNELIGSGGSLADPVARYWNTPMYYLVPQVLLRRGENIISVHLYGYVNSGSGLGTVYLGPERILKPKYERRYFRLHTTFIVACFFSLVIAIVMGLMWGLRRSVTMYGWFALAAFMSTIYLSNHFIRDIPFSRNLWESIFHLSIEFFTVFLTLFVHRYYGIVRKVFEKTLFFLLVVISLVIPAVDEGNMIVVFNMMHAASIMLVGYNIFLVSVQWHKHRQHQSLVLLIAFAIGGGFAIHDLSMGILLPLHLGSFILPFAAPVLLSAIAWLLISQFINLQYQADQFTEHLREKVEQTKRQLTTKHETVRQLEKKQTISEERERMMRDLHDGLGGQLVSALSQVNNKQASEQNLKQTLSDALLDLRLVIDSLDEDNQDLSTMLGMLRMRMEPQLKASGITLNWMLKDDAGLDNFGHETALHLLRIVQEAITNAIRHAHCSEINLEIKTVDGKPCIAVTDNGRGIGDAKAGRGRGNMRRRAEKIGAELSVDSSDRGVKVQVMCMLINH